MRMTGIRKWSLTGVVATLALLLWGGTLGPGVRAQAIVLFAINADGDAYVDSANPNQNYPAGPMATGVSGNDETLTFVHFPLSGLPSDFTLTEATLRVYRLDPQADPAKATVAAVTGSWTETGINWNNKPGATSSANTVAAASGSYAEWTVTQLVQEWLVGTLPNNGFQIISAGDVLHFASRETGRPPQLVLKGTMRDNPDGHDNPNNPYADLGDAPDRTNHHGQNNTAYADTNTPGRFPTVRDVATGAPIGPRHLNEKAEGYLGDAMTREREADQGPDADTVNNILNNSGAISDFADKDRADDGWQNPGTPLVDCQRVELTVRVHRATTSSLEKMYLNVWYDGNRDGDWEDTGVCTFENGQQARSYEWIVQDHAVDMTAIAQGSFVDIPVATLLVHSQFASRTHWMRFTLSERPAPRNPQTNLADGRGPSPNGQPEDYKFGETEDVLQRPQPEGQIGPQDLVLTKEVVGTRPTTYPGVLTYRIRLKNNGNAAVQSEIRDEVLYPQHLLRRSASGPYTFIDVTEISPGVSPLSAQLLLDRSPSRRLDQTVYWQGTLAVGAEVQLEFDVHVHPVCPENQISVQIVNTAQARARSLDGTVIADNLEDSVRYDALCPGVSVDAIDVEQTISDRSPDSVEGLSGNAVTTPAFNSNLEISAGGTAVPVEFAMSISFERVNINAQEAANDAIPAIDCQIVSLDPGESLSLTTPVDLTSLFADATGDIPDDSQPTLFRSTVRVQLVPPDASSCTIDDTNPNPVKVHSFQFELRPYDLGDAPDSTNHAGAAMTAYAGTPARFPSVFDPATDPGGPQGPLHMRPWHFHLGENVEFEVDADLGPAPRNIDPPANAPDRDGDDDGAKPHAWTLKNCETTTVPVRVFISPQAANWFQQSGAKGYLNAWLDGNRNGSWADGGKCTDAAGNVSVALEHIIIDHPVDVAALGPGLHTLSVLTGPVPWPADQAQKHAWVRLTLSEREANKPLTTEGISHGDGRGFAVPFRTGETEDYLLVPKGSANDGPKLAVAMQVNQITSFIDASVTAAAPNPTFTEYILLLLHTEVKYSNPGTQTAENVELNINLPDNLPDDALFRLVGSPDLGLPTEWRPYGGFRGGVRVAVGDVDAGEEGRVVVLASIGGGTANGSQAGAADVSYLFKVVGSGDNVPDVTVDASAEVEPSSPMILGMKSPSSQYIAQAGGATCADTVDIFGTGAPGKKVIVYILDELGVADQREVLTGDYDNDGRVDAADYTVWRDNLGILAGDYNADGVVNAADYAVWRANFGAMAPAQYNVLACFADDTECNLAVGAQPASIGQEPPQTLFVWGRTYFKVDPGLPVDLMSMIIEPEGSERWFVADSFSFGTERNAQAHLQPGLSYEVSAALCNNEVIKGDFTYDAVGNRIATPLAVEDGKLVGSFQTPDSSQAAMSDSDFASLSITTSDGNDVTYKMPLIAPYREGTVRDEDGNPLQGAEVALLHGGFLGSETAWMERLWPWQGPAYGWKTPQTTGADGKYAFQVERGRYRLLVRKDGYQRYLSPVLYVPGPAWIGRDVVMSTALPEPEDEVVLDFVITDVGFDPPFAQFNIGMPPSASGSVTPQALLADHREAPLLVRVTNSDLFEHAVRLNTGQVGDAATKGESGMLLPGDSYTVRLVVSPPGFLELSDPTDASVLGTVLLTEEDSAIFLPTMRR